MKTCTFFGHRTCPDSLRPILQERIEDLIRNDGVEMFYVGNQGQFDSLVRAELKKLKAKYPQIEYAVVLAYMPVRRATHEDHSDTMLPEGIEAVHPRYAISWRNKWMVLCKASHKTIYEKQMVM